MKQTIEADEKIALRTYEACPAETGLAMESLALLSSIISGFYQDQESWQNRKWQKASMNLAVWSWNYLSLVRHSIFLGYYGEAQSLRRSWFERMTRAHLLIASQSDELTERWLDGRLRDQVEVIELLRDSVQDPELGRRMHDTLIAKWEYLNEHSHSDMDSIMWRTETVDPNTFLNDETHEPQDVFVDNPISGGTETRIGQDSGLLNFVEAVLTEDKKQAFKEVVGDNPVLGGMAAKISQKAALLHLTEDVLTSCSSLVVIADNRAERRRDIGNLSKRRQQLIDENGLELPLRDYDDLPVSKKISTE
ncbi:MAG: hypothetical protein V3T49_06925 [Dehalococcoidia bacterium]